MGLKKEGNVQGRVQEVNGGECSLKRRTREEVMGALLFLAVVRTDRERGLVNSNWMDWSLEQYEDLSWVKIAL